MIYIDFIGGSHGNFLEVACNAAAGIYTTELPFNSNGAAHHKNYVGDAVFQSGHYSFWKQPILSNRVISIQITADDLLPLSQISFLRAGDFGYDNDELETNTFHKFNNSVYTWVLKNLLQSFFENQIQQSYQKVKDPTWPDARTLIEFQSLPNWIKRECVEFHKLELLELSALQPNCPRHVLREFFQIGFEDPINHGFMKQQREMIYVTGTDVYCIDYSVFYTQRFLEEIKNIADWAGLLYTDKAQQHVKTLHDKFLAQQPYKDSKQKCDNIIKDILQGQQLPKVNLLEESYINAELKRQGHECRY